METVSVRGFILSTMEKKVLKTTFTFSLLTKSLILPDSFVLAKIISLERLALTVLQDSMEKNACHAQETLLIRPCVALEEFAMTEEKAQESVSV